MYLYIMKHYHFHCSSMFLLVLYVFYLLLTIFLKKTLTYSCFHLGGKNRIDSLLSVAYTYLNSFIWALYWKALYHLRLIFKVMHCTIFSICEPATLLKVTFLHGFFHVFYCKNGTKLRKASDMLEVWMPFQRRDDDE